MDGRTISMDSYRYGFQNQEKDDEMKGAGNMVNFKFRIHDSRIGRFFCLDPLAYKFPHNSPYAFSENVLIDHIEFEGLEKIHHLVYNKKENKWVTSWIETDNSLTENVNAYHHFDASGNNHKTVVTPWKTKPGKVEKITYSGNIKVGSENRENMYNQFSEESYNKYAFTSIDTRSAPDPTHYGEFSGGYDGANSGGRLSGQHGWDNGGKQMTFGMVGVFTAPFTIVEGGVIGLVGWSGLINSTDDILGGLSNEEGKSVSQQLATGTNMEGTVDLTKFTISAVGCITGTVGLVKSARTFVITKEFDNNIIPSAIGTNNDGKSSQNFLTKP
jgi:hypothetical protein